MRLGSSRVSKATYFASLERLDHIEKFGQRKTHPRNHHGPSLDAAHPVNPFLRRTDFQQIVEVEDPGLSHQTLDRHLPAFGFKIGRRRRDAFLVGREFVEIIVMRDVLERSLRFGHAEAAGGIRRRRRGNDPFDLRRVDFARGHGIETPINQAGGHGAGREDSRPDEVPAIEINGGVGHLAGGYFVWLFQRINNQLNDKEN